MHGQWRNLKQSPRVSLLRNSPREKTVSTASTSIAEWSSRVTIRNIQSEFMWSRLGSQQDDNELITINGKIWIHDKASEMKIKLLTVAHSENIGRRGGAATAAILDEEFQCTVLTRDVKEFVASCLLWMLSRGKSISPWQMSFTSLDTHPNEVLHFDYLYLGDTGSSRRYALVLRNDCSAYAWIFHLCQLTRSLLQKPFRYGNVLLHHRGFGFQTTVSNLLTRLFAKWLRRFIFATDQHFRTLCEQTVQLKNLIWIFRSLSVLFLVN